MKEVVRFHPLGQSNKSVDSSMDWVDHHTSEMSAHEGKSFACHIFLSYKFEEQFCMELGGIHFSFNSIINHIHMDDYNHSSVEEPQVMMDHEKNSDLKALMKRKEEENFGQTLVDLKKSHTDDLSMGEIER